MHFVGLFNFYLLNLGKESKKKLKNKMFFFLGNFKSVTNNKCRSKIWEACWTTGIQYAILPAIKSRDNTLANKLVYTPNDHTQNYPF